jgi:hypothetical protein
VGLERGPLDVAPHQIGEGLRPAKVEQRAGVGDRRLDLAAVAHDAGIGQQAPDVRLAPGGDRLGVESLERRSEGLAFAQDGDPGEPRLEAVEDQLLPERPATAFRHAPFGVVVGDVEGIVTAPSAPARVGHAGNPFE